MHAISNQTVISHVKLSQNTHKDYAEHSPFCNHTCGAAQEIRFNLQETK